MNQVALLGRIANELELKSTESGISVCRFTVAVNRRFKNASGNYDADFIRCVAWRDQADFVYRYFEKGSMIAVCGELHSSSYEKDGKRIYSTEVYTDRIDFTGDMRQEYEDYLAKLEGEHRKEQFEREYGK